MESSDNSNNALIKDCTFYRKTERLNGACRLRTGLYRLYITHYCLHPQYLQQVSFDTFPKRCIITQLIYFWKTALRVSGGIPTHRQEHTQLYLQYLVLVKPLLLPAAIAAGSSNGLTSTRYCKYSCVCAPDDGGDTT